MNISYNWLKEFLALTLKPEELENVLTMLGIEVESINDLRTKFDKFVIAHVISCERHPNADKLTVCKVGWGICEGTVICGAPNVAEGQKVVLGMPGAIVPQNGMKIEERAIRGIKSEGMLCSQFELGLGEDKSGIWVLPNDAPIGETAAEYLGLNDVIYDISVTPNRADCLSHLGVARELAAYLRTSVIKPNISLNEAGDDIHNSVCVEIHAPDKCPRYTARVIRGAKIGASPLWLQLRILLAGMRPVNSVVDVTNLVLLECGQPLHAFDLNTLAGNKIIMKTAGDGEKFTTLDGKERTLDNQMLMICDSEKSIAVGGVMGGENTEISDLTTDILLEAAYFNPSSVRRTAKKLGIQSEASYRFERGVDPDGIIYASNRAAALIAELTGGVVDNGIIDVYPKPVINSDIKLRFNRANDIIGISITKEQVCEMLEALQFEISERNDDYIVVKPPSFRVDISLEIDVIEEIARLYNYDNIEPDYASTIDFGGTRLPDYLTVPAIKRRLRNALADWGIQEAMHQNITDPDSAMLFGENPIKIANPLGEELSAMRTSLIPSMLKTIAKNQRSGSNNLAMFEIGKTFHEINTKLSFIDGITEHEELMVAITGKAVTKSWDSAERQYDFYDIKGIAEHIADFMKLPDIKFVKNENHGQQFSEHSMILFSGSNQVAIFGELAETAVKRADIASPVFAAIFDMNLIYSLDAVKPRYTPVSQYPSMERDLAFLMDMNIESEDVKNAILNSGGELLRSVELFDLFAGKSLGEGVKSLAFSLVYSSFDRTLVDDEVESSLQAIIQQVETKFNAKLRK